MAGGVDQAPVVRVGPQLLPGQPERAVLADDRLQDAAAGGHDAVAAERGVPLGQRDVARGVAPPGPEPGGDALVAADDLDRGLGDQGQQLVEPVRRRQRQRAVGQRPQLDPAPPLEVGELAGLAVQPGPLDDLGGLLGVDRRQLEVALVGHGGRAVVAGQGAHRLAAEGQHRDAEHGAHPVLQRAGPPRGVGVGGDDVLDEDGPALGDRPPRGAGAVRDADRVDVGGVEADPGAGDEHLLSRVGRPDDREVGAEQARHGAGEALQQRLDADEVTGRRLDLGHRQDTGRGGGELDPDAGRRVDRLVAGEPHRATSVALLSRTTVTRICPG